MKAPLLHLLAAASTMVVVRAQGFRCDVPTHGCTNGMFNRALCECQCIPPFCADQNGDCTDPSQDCGDVKWRDCTRGVNCPWWVNALRAESCTTGPNVSIVSNACHVRRRVSMICSQTCAMVLLNNDS